MVNFGADFSSGHESKFQTNHIFMLLHFLHKNADWTDTEYLGSSFTHFFQYFFKIMAHFPSVATRLAVGLWVLSTVAQCWNQLKPGLSHTGQCPGLLPQGQHSSQTSLPQPPCHLYPIHKFVKKISYSFWDIWTQQKISLLWNI